MKNKKPSKIKRFLKGFGKTIGFAALYIMFAIGTAAGIIFLSPSGAKNDDTFVIPVQLTKILNNLQLVKALDVDLGIDVQTPDNQFNILLDAQLDLDEGFENLGAEGVITVSADEQNVVVNFNYQQGQIYTELLKGKFAWQTDSLFAGIADIATLLDVEIPSMDGLDLKNLDANTVLRFLSDLEEDVGKDSIVLNINVPIIGQIQLLCDLNYSIKEIRLPKTEISEGTSITLSSNLQYPDQVEIVTPTQNEYVNATSLVDVATATIGLLKNEGIGFDATLTTPDLAFEGNINVDLSEMSASLEFPVLNLPLKVICRDKTLYLEYGNILLQFSLSDADLLQSFLKNNFDLDVDIVNIADFLTKLQSGEIMSAIHDQLDKNSDSVDDSVDLGKIENIEQTDGNIAVSIRDFGTVDLTVQNGTLSDLCLSCDDLTITASVVEAKPIEISDTPHADVALALPAITSILNLAKQDYVAGNLVVESGEQVCQFDFAWDRINAEAQFLGQLFGDQLKLTVQNGKLYVDFKGLQVFGDKNEIDYILSLLGEENLEQSSSLLSTLLDLKRGQFVGIEQSQSGLRLSLLDNIVLDLAYGETLETIKIFDGNNSAVINFNNDHSVAISKVDHDQYLPASKIANKIKVIYDCLTNENSYWKIEGSLDDLHITGAINYENDALNALVNLSYLNKTATVQYADQQLFLDLDDLHLALNINEIDEIVDILKSSFNLDLNDQLDGIAQAQKLASMLNDLSLSFENNRIVALCQDFKVIINVDENSFDGIEIAGKNFAISASPSTKTEFAEPDTALYSPAVDFVRQIATTCDYLSQNGICLDFDLSIDNNDFAGFVNYVNNNLSLYANGTIGGVKMEVRLADNVVYFNTITRGSDGSENQSAQIKFDLNDVDKVLTFLKDEFDLNFFETYSKLKNGLTQSDLTQNIDLGDLLSKLSLGYKKGANKNTLTILYDGFDISVDFSGTTLKALQVCNQSLKLNATVASHRILRVNKNEYFDIAKILPFVQKINDLLNNKKFNINANVNIYRALEKIYTANNVVLQADLTGKPQIYANANISGQTNLSITAGLFGDKLYVDYNNLKLSLNADGLNGLIGSVCDMLNVNSSMLDRLFGTSQNLDGVDLSDLASIVANQDFESPFKLIGLIDSIWLDRQDSNILHITLRGKQSTNAYDANDSEIIITANQSRLTNIEIKNIYTDVATKEHINLNLALDSFSSVKKPDLTQNYVDISGAENLIEAVLNTVKYSTVSVSGSVTLDLKPGIIHIKREVPFSANLTLDNLSIKKAVINVGPIPVVDLLLYNLNNDTDWFLPIVHDRNLTIYYQDDYVYMYRSETRSIGGKYEKATMIPLSTLLADPIYYLQWATGLNQSIIDEAEATIEHDINLGNIVKSFSAPTSPGGMYTTTLNMLEITGNDKLGSMVIGIGLSRLAGQNVVSKASFDLDMPLIAGTTLYVQSDNITITPGSYMSTSALNQFVNSYKSRRGAEIVEYEAYDGKWERTPERSFTVAFDADGGIFDSMNYDSISGHQGTQYTPPKLTYMSTGSFTQKTDYTLYKFAGWFSSPDFAPDTQVTSFVIPKRNITLYAKWDIVVAYRTIYYYSEKIPGTLPKLLSAQYSYSSLMVRTDYANLGLEEYREKIYTGYVDGVYGTYILKQRLDGWVDEQGYKIYRVPFKSTNLYANYVTYEIVKK